METCKEKQQYRTKAEAEAVVRAMRKDLRKAGGGHGIRRLNAYRCDEHVCWHVGRSNRYGVKLQRPPRVPSTGELKRKLRRIEERMDRDRRQRAFLLGRIIERDRQREYQNALAAIGYQPEGQR
jgi:hypothetical protein